jgi:hypothetical protein
MTERKTSGEVTASELLAELADDRQFQENRRRTEAELARQQEVLRLAEKPILDDLRRIGYVVESISQLNFATASYRPALPVLIRHLEQGHYPARVREGLATALAVKPAVAYWPRLISLLMKAPSSGEQEALAAAIAACATHGQFDDLVELIQDPALGVNRIHFVRPLVRIGGEAGRRVVERLTDDPVVGTEARLVLARAKRRS